LNRSEREQVPKRGLKKEYEDSEQAIGTKGVVRCKRTTQKEGRKMEIGMVRGFS
jgi:5-methylcytosine-specific restriction endonuclease McrBC regulatory subunit McrC